jgi:hypothetical protein
MVKTNHGYNNPRSCVQNNVCFRNFIWLRTLAVYCWKWRIFSESLWNRSVCICLHSLALSPTFISDRGAGHRWIDNKCHSHSIRLIVSSHGYNICESFRLISRSSFHLSAEYFLHEIENCSMPPRALTLAISFFGPYAGTYLPRIERSFC